MVCRLHLFPYPTQSAAYLVLFKLLLYVVMFQPELAMLQRVAYTIDEDEVHSNFMYKAKTSTFSSVPYCLYTKTNETSTSGCRQAIILNTSTDKLISKLQKNDMPSMILKLSFRVRQLLEVNEMNQDIKLLMHVEKTWNDCRIQWNSHDDRHLEIRPNDFNQLNIFQPFVTVPEALSHVFPEGSETRIIVYCNGNVELHYNQPVELSCKMFVEMYPFDIHLCTITFVTSYRGWLLQMVAKNEFDEDFVKNDAWSFNVLPKKCAHSCSPNKTTCNCREQQYRMVLRRKPIYQLINLLLPASFIVFISSCVFLVPPDSSDKMSLSLAILLSLYMFCQMMYDKMPETGSTIPLLSQYFLVCIGFVTASCIFSAISSAIFAAHPRVPDVLRKLVVLLAPYLMPDMIEQNKHSGAIVRTASKRRRTKRQSVITSFEMEVRNTENEAEVDSLSEPPMSSFAVARSEAVDDKCDDFFSFYLNAPETLTWAAVGALFDRMLFVLHTFCNLIVLAIFISKGYSSWSGYAELRSSLSDADIKVMCDQLAKQGAKFDDLPCQSVV